MGARPNFMKIAPLYREMKQHPTAFEPVLVHTGQHYDEKMSQVFFDELELPKPDIYLGVGSGSHAVQTAEIMRRFEIELMKHQPEMILLVGDVNSTIACALTAAKSKIDSQAMRTFRRRYVEFIKERKTESPLSAAHLKQCHSPTAPIIAHIEAGERSFDFGMPEEINRVTTDVLSDILFTTSVDSDASLLAEGIDPRKTFCVGNIMIDSLQHYLSKANPSEILDNLNLKNTDYGLVTLHRPGNVDEPATLKPILSALIRISERLDIIFPMHPRTRKLLPNLGKAFNEQLATSRVHFIEPVGYFEFLGLQKSARLILTDSGGIQVESSFLGVPCLTLRPNTEWQITLREGTNRLVAPEEQAVVTAAFHSLTNRNQPRAQIAKWDGNTSKRIVDLFIKIFL